nr:DUF2868 domain-containing protein [Cellvibrionaceae bacterium]
MSVVIIIALLSGAAATLNAVAGSQNTLNIFWILIVLLGFNLLSFLIWLLVTLLPKRSSRQFSSGPLGGIFKQLLEWLTTYTAKQCAVRSASQVWLSWHFQQKQGRWFLGSITHLSWLCYIIGGGGTLLVVLATKQYNFIWSSTLLSDSAFIYLTKALAAPMAWLHWPVPTLVDVSSSQQGASAEVLSQTRKAWAYFLLGCLFFYGVLPRAISWLLCTALRRMALKKIDLDFTATYYQKLQQHWQQHRRTSEIIDSDSHPIAQNRLTEHAFTHKTLPQNALCLGVELSQSAMNGLSRKPSVNVVDKTTQHQAVDAIKNINNPILFFVNVQKAPDRGTNRLMKNLVSSNAKGVYWLVCIDQAATQNTQPCAKHFFPWQDTANQLGIVKKHCVLLETISEQQQQQQ